MITEDSLSLGEESLGLWLKITETKGSLINAFLCDKCQLAYDHYPTDDYLSNCKTLQYFYHSHRDNGEHGHIHVFARNTIQNTTHHIVGIGLSDIGLPIGLFIINPNFVNEKKIGISQMQKMFSHTFYSHETIAESDLTCWIKFFCASYHERIFELLEKGSKASTSNQEILASCQIDWAQDLDNSNA